MIKIKSQAQIEKMHTAGKLMAECHRQLRNFIAPGLTTLEVNNFCDKFIKDNGAKAEQIGYMGYPYATCTSVNDEICHSIPGKYKLKDGDIITVDMVINLDGWLADSAWSYRIGTVSEEAERLLQATEKALYIGIEKAVIGNRIGDISHAIQEFAEGQGYSVVKEYRGHGIGKNMHEDPDVPHFGRAGKGPRITEGMVFTIEPMLNIGGPEAILDADGWTARTKDGSLCAQYEHTLAITKDGPLIMTLQ